MDKRFNTKTDYELIAKELVTKEFANILNEDKKFDKKVNKNILKKAWFWMGYILSFLSIIAFLLTHGILHKRNWSFEYFLKNPIWLSLVVAFSFIFLIANIILFINFKKASRFKNYTLINDAFCKSIFNNLDGFRYLKMNKHDDLDFKSLFNKKIPESAILRTKSPTITLIYKKNYLIKIQNVIFSWKMEVDSKVVNHFHIEVIAQIQILNLPSSSTKYKSNYSFYKPKNKITHLQNTNIHTSLLKVLPIYSNLFLLFPRIMHLSELKELYNLSLQVNPKTYTIWKFNDQINISYSSQNLDFLNLNNHKHFQNRSTGPYIDQLLKSAHYFAHVVRLAIMPLEIISGEK
ncbi:hypothetical protein [Mycoplasmopsis pulmonis]|uniref:hypothetical protein n=1 Tax=Mycoplasmopsis pulmonis TaxID=2107 RepID=UPI00100508AA|nr:hypothetical protein [Mycoplasmopsis pulmonis]VEU68458.1 Uncharacterised protein [Mycoplasmopsis pulmonis]